MRNIATFLFLALGFSACNKCDDGSASLQDDALSRTFYMKAFTIGSAVDLDEDGSHNHDLVKESDCHENSFLSLQSNKTFLMRIASPVSSASGSEDCVATFLHGSWMRMGDLLYLNPNNGSTSITMSIHEGASSLKGTIEGIDHPVHNPETGEHDMVMGDADMHFAAE